MEVLEEFSNTLSLRKGGRQGLKKLIDSQMVGTIELNTGLQISGNFSRMIRDEDDQVIYFNKTGPTALSFREKELIGHGIEHHSNGFGSPLGKLKNINLAIEDMGPVDLKAYNFYDGKWLEFEFESGIKVEGFNITGIRNIQGKLMLIQLSDCTVKYKDEVLFRPEWGTYDMAVGKEIVSAFAGPADSNSFPDLYRESLTKTIKNEKNETSDKRENLYKKVKDYRLNSVKEKDLIDLFEKLRSENSKEWLVLLEMLEIAKDSDLSKNISDYLFKLSEVSPELRILIYDGIEMIGKN